MSYPKKDCDTMWEMRKFYLWIKLISFVRDKSKKGRKRILIILCPTHCLQTLSSFSLSLTLSSIFRFLPHPHHEHISRHSLVFGAAHKGGSTQKDEANLVKINDRHFTLTEILSESSKSFSFSQSLKLLCSFLSSSCTTIYVLVVAKRRHRREEGWGTDSW